MVIFTKQGATLLKSIALGEKTVGVSGDVMEFTDELSILLTKMSTLVGSNQSTRLNYDEKLGLYLLGSGTPSTVIPAAELFTFFGVTATTEPMSIVYTEGHSNLLYSSLLGEPMLYSAAMNSYMLNDSSFMSSCPDALVLNPDRFQELMPDLFSEHKKAEKSFKASLKKAGLTGLKLGSTVSIKTYSELIAVYGESAMVIGDDDTQQIVDQTDDPDAVRFVKALGYPKVSADYYDGKSGTVVDIDKTTGIITVDIDGQTKHTKFIENGQEYTSEDEETLFTVEYLTLIKA